MDNLKSFDPNDVDETITRVVTYGDRRYLLFPYINATGAAPEFRSIGYVINGAAATVADFSALTALLKQAAVSARWFISFNTPWLLPLSQTSDRKRTEARDSRK